MRIAAVIFFAVILGFAAGTRAGADEFKKREAQIAQYKTWLDAMGPVGSQFWVKLDSKRRPHRLYLGDGFFRADAAAQERFIDIYSNYLAGHPEKFMLIDLFDAITEKPVGEYGFGGFRLYSKAVRTTARD